MSNFFRSLPKHIKTAFISIFRHLAMSLSAISAVTVTLLLFSTFLMIAGNISLFTKNIEDDLRIHVVLQPDVVKQADIDNVQKDIEGIQGVKKVTCHQNLRRPLSGNKFNYLISWCEWEAYIKKLRDSHQFFCIICCNL
mgnify:CR=1 FL=1